MLYVNFISFVTLEAHNNSNENCSSFGAFKYNSDLLELGEVWVIEVQVMDGSAVGKSGFSRGAAHVSTINDKISGQDVNLQ